MENPCSSTRERRSFWDARCLPPQRWLACWDSRRRRELTPMTIIVKSESARQIISSTKPSSIMAGTAGKRTMPGMNHAQRLLAGMANGHFTLQVLQKTVREMVQRPLAPGILLVTRAAVRTDEFHLVLLRIAVQSSPPGAAYANRFCITPVHGSQPPPDPRPQTIRCTKQ